MSNRTCERADTVILLIRCARWLNYKPSTDANHGMSDPGPRVRVLVVPVYKRHWLLHGWVDASDATILKDSSDAVASSSSDQTLDIFQQTQRRVQLLGKQLGDTVSQ